MTVPPTTKHPEQPYTRTLALSHKSNQHMTMQAIVDREKDKRIRYRSIRRRNRGLVQTALPIDFVIEGCNRRCELHHGRGKYVFCFFYFCWCVFLVVAEDGFISSSCVSFCDRILLSRALGRRKKKNLHQVLIVIYYGDCQPSATILLFDNRRNHTRCFHILLAIDGLGDISHNERLVFGSITKNIFARLLAALDAA